MIDKKQLKAGLYWYRGPLFREGKRLAGDDEDWTVVKIHSDGCLAMIGSDWDLMQEDVNLLQKHGHFVQAEPPSPERTSE